MSSRADVYRRSRRRGRIAHAFGGGGRPGVAGRMRLLIAIAALLLAVGVLGGSVAAAAGLIAKGRYDEIAEGVVPPEELISKFPRGGARIYDRNGELIYEFVDELAGLRRPVPLAEISPWMIAATISTEDASFYENNGLNLRGLIRAALENLTPFSGSFLEGSGGSSITQQLAKNVYIPLDERAERSVDRKIRETVIALELTEKYSKDQILEWYLNSISYGGIYTGVQAAAEGYFDKDASELTLAEAALLAGIPQSPALYAPLRGGVAQSAVATELQPDSATRIRQLEVIDLMERHEAITPQQAQAARDEQIEFEANHFEIEAAHLVLGRIAEEIRERFGERALFRDGLEVTTTIDLELQREAEEILDQHIIEYGEEAGLYNGAMVALDPRTGEILVYVGSRDYFREDIEGRNDNVVAPNSPGSTLKPFTFMTAFMQGWGTGTAILDTPHSIIDPATGQAYTPRDPIGQLQGPMTAAKALGNSLNITAVKAIQFAGVDRVVNMLKQVGYTTLDNPGGYGPALTLGGVDITLLDQIIGYSVLANGGTMRGQELVVDSVEPGERRLEPVALLRVEDADGDVLYEFTEPVERRVLQAEFPYLVTSILSDGSNQCLTYGVCNALALPDGRPSAAKTGTSEPFENSRAIGETWTIGYTPNLVAGVWSGNADNSEITGISSTSVSLRSWKSLMMAAIERFGLDPEPFQRPPGVVEREVCWPSGRLPTDECPKINRYTSLYAEGVLPRDGEEMPEAYDSWWQVVRVDSRTGLLASPTTPANFVEESVRLVLPEDEVAKWDGLREWAEQNEVASLLAPSEELSSGPTLVRITSPIQGQKLQGRVIVRGRAASEDFERFSVEWGRGAAPTSWVTLRTSQSPQKDGTLAIWDTQPLPNGDYALRVLLEDAKRGTLYFKIPVTVDNGEDAVGSDLAPQVWLTTPVNGAELRGIVSISGFAGSGKLEETIVDVGRGLEPDEWVELGRTTSPIVNSRMATWDTTKFEDGPYTVRVRVRDEELGTAEIRITVTLANGGDTGESGG